MSLIRISQPGHRPVEIDSSTPRSDCDQMQRRLERIETHYRQLDDVLAALESKLESDQRLKAIDGAEAEFESEFGILRKRKWRPAKKRNATRRRSGSSDPRKPR